MKEIKGLNHIDKKLQRQILLLIIFGVVLISADIISSFSSNTVKITREDNKEYMLRSDKAGHISLRARVHDENTDISDDYDITLSPYSKSAKDSGAQKSDKEADISSDELASDEIRRIAMGFNDDTSVRRVSLPSTLSTGQTVTWTVIRHTHTPLIILLLLLFCILLFRQRHAPFRKQRKLQLESIDSQLPEFINRLVLLLNAGLVLNTAFEKTIIDGSKLNKRENDFFWSSMTEIYRTVKETNSSINLEFRQFARNIGKTELIRISNILNDNISKGVMLTDKLQAESEMLWLNRKRSCEERGRIAETKLTLPLTIFLLVLVVITVSPALLEL